MSPGTIIGVLAIVITVAGAVIVWYGETSADHLAYDMRKPWVDKWMESQDALERERQKMTIDLKERVMRLEDYRMDKGD